MLERISKISMVVAMAASFAVGPMARPASANTGQTWTTIEAAAAVIGGIVLYNNYVHKRQAANRVVGYTRNGGTVYGDGRIVFPNGQTVYPNANGVYPWGQAAYYSPRARGYSYDSDDRGRYERERHARRSSHRERRDHDGDNGGGRD